jgi:hypothetical protein
VFQGTVPVEMRSLILECSRSWPREQGGWIGCSGNLTIERVLASDGWQVHGNDISIYTCMLGAWFSRQAVDLTPREDVFHDHGLDWLLPYCDGAAGTVATVLLGTRFLAWAGKPQPYYRRMVEGTRRQWPRMFEGTRAKVEAHALRLASFTADDVLAYMADLVPKDAPFASFPSFYTGPSTGYTAMWRPIDEHFTWPAPNVPEIDESGKARMLEMAMDRPHWIIGVREEIPELEPYKRGWVQVTPRAMPFNVYASGTTTRVVTPRQPMSPLLVAKLGPDEELTGDLALHRISQAEFNGLRALYLNKGIAPGAPPYPVAVTCAGKLVGAFCYDRPKFDPDCAYLMSDFPVHSDRYRRLAKLIVMAAMSTEAKTLMERSFSRRIRAIGSTAFTNNPMSAKYGRGVPGMKMMNRRKADDGVHEWLINYVGPVGQWDLAGALDLWQKKHGSDQRAEVPA